MGFFSFDFDHAKGQIQISDQGWIWFAFTLPLTVLTLGLSYLWIWLKDPNRQNHIGKADVNPRMSRKFEKAISRRSSISSIATGDIERFEELLDLVKERKKGKSREPKPLPPPKSHNKCASRAVTAK